MTAEQETIQPSTPVIAEPVVEPVVPPVEPPVKKTVSLYSVNSDLTKLSTLVTSLVGVIQKMADEIRNLKNAPVPTPAPVLTPSPVVDSVKIEVEEVNFLSTVPSNLLKVANEVLGKKFKFECIPSKDKPFFDFVVIVPAEYSQEPAGVIDRRSRMISNAESVDGVKAWCELVKSNVIRKLGKQLPINV